MGVRVRDGERDDPGLGVWDAVGERVLVCDGVPDGVGDGV